MHRNTIRWLGAGTCAGIALIVLRLTAPKATITPPSGFPNANLKVDLQLNAASADRVKTVVITKAHLRCPIFDLAADEEANLPRWMRERRLWCGNGAINLPLSTDASGKTVLWFSGSLSPWEAGIRNESAPSLYVGLEGQGRALQRTSLEVFAPDHWRAEMDLSR